MAIIRGLFRLLRLLITGKLGDKREPSVFSANHGPVEIKTKPLEGLDASHFAPVTGDEALELIKGFGSLWGWMRRGDSPSRIPSAKLPRIQVIDRGMVGLGLITPEELARAHETGTRMDAARGGPAVALDMADAAVLGSRAERLALKAEKKAEAAKRAELRARQVAERRHNDIVFLGRGVSRGLADRRTHVEKLQALDLPVLATPSDVARALDVTVPRLKWLAYHSDASRITHYVCFQVPKKSGGIRTLSAPHRTIARCQEWILREILEKVPVHAAAHGFVPGRSTVTNALPHVAKAVVVNVDLENFFPTVTFPRVKGMFQGLGYSPAAATILALLSTDSPRRKVRYDGDMYYVATGPRSLPQGACTSPALSNLVSRRVDARLAGLGSKLGWTYTRYADDMTFSRDGTPADNVGYLLARVRHIVSDEGFRINEKKTRVLGRSSAQTVTGIVVNERPGVRRSVARRIRAILHRAKKDGLRAQNRDNRQDFASYLQGLIAYISMVNPAQGLPLRRAWKDMNIR